MPDLEELDDDLDEFVFAPEPWDVATELGLQPAEWECEPLAELADAVLAWARGPEVDELIASAVEALWSTSLEAEIRDGLQRVARLGDEWRPAAAALAAEFERDPRAATITKEVVRAFAMEAGARSTPFLFCLCCIDDAVTAVDAGDADERRARACRAALAAVSDVGVSLTEIEEAIAARAPERIATDERRRAVRRRLGRLGHLGRRSMPALAAELRRLADEPLPPDPADDDVWEVVSDWLLASIARPWQD